MGQSRDGYGAEGDVGQVLPTAALGAVPLHRYWNAMGGDHFYTTNIDELGPTGKNGWVYERIEGHCFPTHLAGSVPLYRYYHQAGVDHFYTTNIDELGPTGRNGYAAEGVACYMLSPPAAASGEAKAPAP